MLVYYFKLRGSRHFKKRRTLRLTALDDVNAWGKALALHPAKFLKLKRKYTMDLITAKVEAAALSIKKGKRVYINLNEEEEECEVSHTPAPKKENVLAIFAAGNEVQDIEDVVMMVDKPVKAPSAIPKPVKGAKKSTLDKPTKQPKTVEAVKVVKQVKKSKTLNNKVMSTKVKVKKGAKKSPAKKVTYVKGVSGIMTPVKGGAALEILNLLKKKQATKQEMAKVSKTKEANISWYISKLKNNGHKIQLSEEGKYRLAK